MQLDVTESLPRGTLSLPYVYLSFRKKSSDVLEAVPFVDRTYFLRIIMLNINLLPPVDVDIRYLLA